MARVGDGVYDQGSDKGGKVQGLPRAGEVQGMPPAKGPTGRPNVGGNPVGKDPQAAANAGAEDAKVNDRSARG